MQRVAFVLIALVGCAGRPCGLPQVHVSETGAWEFSEERATARWCALNQTGPRYAAVLTPSGADQDADTLESLYEGPVRISIQDAGIEQYAWNGFSYSTWDIDQSHLVYARFYAGLPGGRMIAVDLKAPGRVLWEAPTSHPMPQGWSLWSNRMAVEIRGSRVYVWSLDGGRFLEILDRATGRSLGWQEFPMR